MIEAMDSRRQNFLRIPLDLLIALAFGWFAIVAGSDSTDLFGDDGQVESALKIVVVVALVLAAMAVLLTLQRIWGAASGSIWRPRAELTFAAAFGLWFMAALLAARI